MTIQRMSRFSGRTTRVPAVFPCSLLAVAPFSPGEWSECRQPATRSGPRAMIAGTGPRRGMLRPEFGSGLIAVFLVDGVKVGALRVVRVERRGLAGGAAQQEGEDGRQ